MMNIKRHEINKMFLLFMMFLFLSNCHTQKELISNSCKFDKVYLEVMNDAGINTKELKEDELNCKFKKISTNRVCVRQHYSDIIYFEGFLFKGYKTGLWKGYYKGNHFVSICYLGEPTERPVSIDLRNIEGKHIYEIWFSIIR